MTLSALVLVVEDDSGTRSFLSGAFAAGGYGVEAAGAVSEARRLLSKGAYDLAVIDLMLPDGNGMDLVPECRRQRNTGIIFLTVSDKDEDRFLGLRRGADDYMTKPFKITELLLRAENLVRRVNSNRHLGSLLDPESKPTLCQFRDITLDLAGGHLRFDDGRTEALTRSEFQLLHTLLVHQGKTLTRNALMEAIGQSAHHANPRTIDGLILRLRRKLEGKSRCPTLILSVHAKGYRFAETVAWS